MLDVILTILASFISAGLLLLFYYYYMIPNGFTIRMIAGIILTYIPILMSIVLIPYELAQSITKPEYLETEKRNVLYCIYALYYLTMAISYILMPILINFESTSPDDSFWKRVKNSLISILKLYGIIAIIALIIVLIPIALGKIKINSALLLYLLSTVPFCMNLYGLMFSLLIAGIGISRIPFSIWLKSDVKYNFNSKLVRLHKLDEEQPNTREFRRLVRQIKKEYDQNKRYEETHSYPLSKRIRSIAYGIWAFFVSLLSLFFIVLEGSYSFNKSIVSIILYKINDSFLVQFLLILLIGILTIMSMDILTRFDASIFLPRCCINRLHFISFFSYQFKKSQTTQNTFDMWSDRIQKLLPALAFHCQYMAGVTDSSLKIIMGEFRAYKEFDLAIRICGFLVFALSFVTSIFHSISQVIDDIRNAELGEDAFKRYRNEVGDDESDDHSENDIHVNLNDIQFVDKEIKDHPEEEDK